MNRILPPVLYWILRLWFGTVRVKVLNPDVYENYFKGDKPIKVVGGAWHRHVLIVFYHFHWVTNGLIMVSRSRDGELLAGVARRLGYDTVRGSSSKGGRDALSALIEYMNQDQERRFCGTAVDGPQGPPRVLKKGMLAAAKLTDAWFIPIACSGTRVITFRKAWDRTILPLPFSQLIIDFGQPFKVDPSITDEDLERLRIDTERILNDLTDHVDQAAGYKG
jgi:lysophospholipid acyltransferase (LPLAT)-like uncharacterized protein